MPENQSPPPLTSTSRVWRRAWHPVAHAEDVAAAPVHVRTDRPSVAWRRLMARAVSAA